MADIISTNKYLIKRKYKTINGTSYPMDEYQVILFEEESEDCGFIRPQYQWSATTGYLCDYETYTKYTREVKMVSYDSGVTWSVAQPVEERRGAVIAYDSYDCGKPMYKCVETTETGCIVADFKLALYGNDNSLLFVNECDASSSVTRNSWSDDVTPSSIYRAEIGDCVTSISLQAFSGCSSLTRCTIGSGVTSIGGEAFKYCDSIRSVGLTGSSASVEIPDSVTSIGQSAFASCTSLSSVTIPSGVTSISGMAFTNCSGLTRITVNSNNAVYDSRNNCKAIIKTNTNELIQGCKNTIIPNDVTKIGNYSFQGCKGLTSITIPDSVTNIGQSAFASCTSLSSCTIGSGVTSIGYYAFENCSSLTSIDIPSGVKSIGGYVFRNCSGLTSIVIPNTVKTIDSYVFTNCSGLTSCTIGSGVTSIGRSIFSGCSNIRLELDAVTVVTPSVSTPWFSGSSEITTLILGNDVTSIGNSAFTNCYSLSSCTIGSGITSIGYSAFRNCSSLSSVTIYATTPPALADGGVFSFTSNNLTIYVPAASVNAYKTASYWSLYSSKIQAITT